MRGFWSSEKLDSLTDFAFHATPFLKFQEEDQPGDQFNQANNKNQHGRPNWQNRGSTVNVTTTSDTGTDPTRKQSGISS